MQVVVVAAAAADVAVAKLSVSVRRWPALEKPPFFRTKLAIELATAEFVEHEIVALVDGGRVSDWSDLAVR